MISGVAIAIDPEAVAPFPQGLDLTARIQDLRDEGYAAVRGFPAGCGR